MPIRSVAILALPGVQPFELGVAWEGFGIDRTDDGVPAYDCIVASEAGRVETAAGYSIDTPYRFGDAASADLVVVPAQLERDCPSMAVIELLQATVARGARVMSVCSGAFAIGAAGLLDGRDCTTHWRYAAELAAKFPLARVNPDVLFVCDGPVLTSAGTASGLDLCLHLIRQDHGEEIARRVARRMVMPPHRDGGQAQYVDAPIRVHAADTLAGLLDEIGAELSDEHTIESLATRASMSPRTFARRFRAETGTTPHLWLTHQRVLLARRMLEEGDDPIDTVADRCGFGTGAMLRHHFARIVGVSPAAYRRTFRCDPNRLAGAL
ncbi:helix-turn-helix domain-containing protein [Jatrophihabitans sp.]|uniref:GlxA family transcriptional regulator n=1 Tax=Jatrophihabitans sp. TaxID=1932789 RepID=UPI0030C694E9|nr:Transcriptional regulator GlxA family with amidase domain [Jatrophihabitans sp.]